MARFLALVFAVVVLIDTGAAQAERIKDLATVEGQRGNQLIGYGLVVGLAGTGDQTTQIPYSVQAIRNMIAHMGLTLDPNAFLQPNTVAAAMVTATLPTFMSAGQTIDVTVSAMGNAQSLRGGVLLMTELRGADGQVYAIAQGSVLVSGFSASGQAASATVNVPTVGHIPDGATIERAVKAQFASASDGSILLNLDATSFGNATRLAEALNRHFGAETALALGPGQVRVRGPVDPARRVPFLAQLLDVDVTPDRPPAEVVIDAQSGTVVMGEDVKLTSAAVAYGNLSIAIAETPQVAQPLPFSNTGTTQVVPRTQITAEEKTAKILEIRPAPKISDVVRNLNAIGASSSDLIAILQALRSAGALHAHLKVL
ncbi:MAG TPA: flagellar basal body P-ring protein FlgI [Stellaceae bacterium]|nr:flagellar basal body P-ring protein FlgI [Stellaceae bacterium]